VAAAAAQRDLQVVLSALLPAGRQQREAAAGSSGVSVGVDAWLPLVVQAAADVQGDEDENGEGEDGEREQEDVQSEGEGDAAGVAGSWGMAGTMVRKK
jgi:hypothetical protein